MGGTYAMAVTAVVLAILIVVNIFAAKLPTNLTKLDISASKLYSITSNTKVVVNNLQQDVTIYWVVQADQEDYEEKVSISAACFPDAWRHTLRLRQHNRIHRHG